MIARFFERCGNIHLILLAKLFVSWLQVTSLLLKCYVSCDKSLLKSILIHSIFGSKCQIEIDIFYDSINEQNNNGCLEPPTT